MLQPSSNNRLKREWRRGGATFAEPCSHTGRCELQISPARAWSGWTALTHQSEASQRDVSVSQMGVLGARFLGWLTVFWMTDEVDDLAECVGVPELLGWTPPQLNIKAALSRFVSSLSVFYFGVFFSSVIFPSFPRPLSLCLLSSPFSIDSLSLVLFLFLTLFHSFFFVTSLLCWDFPSFLVLFYFCFHYISFIPSVLLNILKPVSL